MSDPKRHHYVPQFLLRAWAEATSDKKVEAFRLDLPNLPSTRHSPKWVAYENNLYALTMPEVAGMEQQAVEKYILRDVDARAAGVHRKLLSEGLAMLTRDDRMNWTRFLMSLRLRQPSMIQQLRTEASEHLEATLKEHAEEYELLSSPKNPPTLTEWVKQSYPGLIENIGMSFFHELVDEPKIGQKILNMQWWLWNFESQNSELIIADHPCIFTTGIDNPNLIIALPVGPRKAFMATKAEQISATMRRQDPKDLLVRINESSLRQARARVYSRNELPRRFIFNRMKFTSSGT